LIRKSIAVVGGFPLASAVIGYNIAFYLSELGHNSNLIIKESHLGEWKKRHTDENPYQSKILKVIPNNKYENKIIRQIREVLLVRKFDIIISIGLGGMWYLPFIGKPYVSYTTGADISELAGGVGYKGYQVKQAQRVFKNANLVLYQPDFDNIAMGNSLGLKSKIPWRQFVDIEFWKAPIYEKNSMEDNILRIFHPANLLWVSKFKGQRLKSNDILFKGFRIYLDNGGKGKLYYIKRGPDVKETEQLIIDLELTRDIEAYSKNLDSNELKDAMLKADVIADQFGVGYFGLITLEAMSLGKPVIVFAPEKHTSLVYPPPEEQPPLLNASNPEEIAQKLLLMQDTKKMYQQSLSSRQWIEKYHHPQRLAIWYWNNIEKYIYKNKK